MTAIPVTSLDPSASRVDASSFSAELKSVGTLALLAEVARSKTAAAPTGVALTATRRTVLTSALGGAALLVGFRFARGAPAAAKPSIRVAQFQPNAFLRIGADGRVTAIIGVCEMGQGVYTALATVLADELEADWQSICVEAAPVDPAFGNPFFQNIQATAASTSIQVFYDTTRQAAAAARMMLVQAAATQWGVPANACHAASGKVLGPASQQLGFGELVATASRLQPPSQDRLELKNPKDFKLIGRSMPRMEIPRIVTGRLPYGIDTVLPEMLTAVVARSPAPGARVKTYQRARALSASGVRAIVEIPSGIAVIADHSWNALRARDLLGVEWDFSSAANLDSRVLEKQFHALTQQAGDIAKNVGSVTKVQAGSSALFSAEYSVPYLTHAPMEPLNCTIQSHAESCDVWVGTQYPSLDRKVVARILGYAPESVNVHMLYMGGAFGRRASPTEDVVVEAAQIVKALRGLAIGLENKPIKTLWTREEDIRGGFYRPMATNLLQATLTESGLPASWLHRIASQSMVRGSEFDFLIDHGIDSTTAEGAYNLPYSIPNLRVELHSPTFGPTVQWMRSVGNTNTCFAVECFLDELASKTHQDPVEFRRKLLRPVKESARLLNVLNIAAEKAHWGRSLPPNTAQGVAIQDFWGTKIAQIAEVAVVANHVQVRRVTCVIDCGLAVNPDGVKALMEGGIVFGLSGALYGEITFAQGRTEQSNFDDYPLARMKATPQIDVHVVQSAEAPVGAAEAAVVPIGPAVCNAIFSITGRRIRSFPIVSSGFEA